MVYALLSALFWVGFDYTRKRLSADFSAPLMSVVFSALVLPCYMIYWFYADKTIPDSYYFFPATVSGLLAGIGSVCFIRALAVGKVAVMLPMLCLTPVISGIFAWFWLGESLSMIEVGAIAILVSASFILQGGRFTFLEQGSTYIFITAICWGCCIVFDKQALQASSIEFHIMYITFVVLAFNGLLFRPKLDLMKAMKFTRFWIGAAVCFSLAVTFQFVALLEVQPGILEALKRAIGIIGAGLIGVYIFREKLTPTQWTCVGVILITSVIFSI
ncbi:EamA family transporter [Pseudoalteromonas sp. SMS1]|uniref:EamA family transporter n=1 Tax=Pseudoalteromonas sp. SMS1 TaxID=2908894 RepID=UPI001F461A66|nr:EamA family transporter [Pseudoalteromonas sp. SMS1]MCF2856056.1 EamA family transporter [Pseudoalteromonas sp. SMS1]